VKSFVGKPGIFKGITWLIIASLGFSMITTLDLSVLSVLLTIVGTGGFGTVTGGGGGGFGGCGDGGGVGFFTISSCTSSTSLSSNLWANSFGRSRLLTDAFGFFEGMMQIYDF
jgi:hypothetical protein